MGSAPSLVDNAELDLIAPEQAIRLLERRFGDPLNTKRMIADLIRDGRIRVTGLFHNATETNPPTGSEADLKLPTSKRQYTIRVIRGVGIVRPIDTRYDVSPAFWSLSQKWEDDVAQRWNWRTANFAITSKRFFSAIRGIKFYREDIEREAATPLSVADDEVVIPPLPPKKSNRGRRRSEDWNAWVAELVAFVHEGDYSSGMSAGKVVELVNERLEARGLPVPDSNKVDRAAAETIKRLAAPN